MVKCFSYKKAACKQLQAALSWVLLLKIHSIVTAVQAARFAVGIGHQHDFVIGRPYRLEVFARVIQAVQEKADAIEAGTLFVVRLNHRPRRIACVGVEKHLVFGFGILVPTV